jgi:chaperonin cofactor prefoldin|tara:strand:- start:547 stop:735 length:189 start_codon:yes stop_codon:yes gene_type:complete
MIKNELPQAKKDVDQRLNDLDDTLNEFDSLFDHKFHEITQNVDQLKKTLKNSQVFYDPFDYL